MIRGCISRNKANNLTILTGTGSSTGWYASPCTVYRSVHCSMNSISLRPQTKIETSCARAVILFWERMLIWFLSSPFWNSWRILRVGLLISRSEIVLLRGCCRLRACLWSVSLGRRGSRRRARLSMIMLPRRARWRAPASAQTAQAVRSTSHLHSWELTAPRWNPLAPRCTQPTTHRSPNRKECQP